MVWLTAECFIYIFGLPDVTIVTYFFPETGFLYCVLDFNYLVLLKIKIIYTFKVLGRIYNDTYFLRIYIFTINQ